MVRRGSCSLRFLAFLVLVVTLGAASGYGSHWPRRAHRHFYADESAAVDKERAWKDFQEFREWRKSKNQWDQASSSSSSSGIPNIDSEVESTESISGQQQFSRIKEFGHPMENGDRVAVTRRNEDHHHYHPYRRNDADSIQESSTRMDDPPPSDHPALMGRFVVNQVDWTSVATISSRKDITSFPFVNVISMSDGPLGNGSGIPYMYLTPLDFTAQDIARDPRATLMMTLAQSPYCKKKVMDPMDPRCARIVLTGTIKALNPGSLEHEVAKKAVFLRHPWLARMPPDHRFFFAKLKIGSIAVLDAFGGPKYVSVKDYLDPPPLKLERQEQRRRFKPQHTEFTNEMPKAFPAAYEV